MYAWTYMHILYAHFASKIFHYTLLQWTLTDTIK